MTIVFVGSLWMNLWAVLGHGLKVLIFRINSNHSLLSCFCIILSFVMLTINWQFPFSCCFGYIRICCHRRTGHSSIMRCHNVFPILMNFTVYLYDAIMSTFSGCDQQWGEVWMGRNCRFLLSRFIWCRRSERNSCSLYTSAATRHDKKHRGRVYCILLLLISQQCVMKHWGKWLMAMW